MTDQGSGPDAAPAQMPGKEPKPHLFRAVKGRTYHYSDKAVLPDHIERDEIYAICGAHFPRWYVYQPAEGIPTCNRCRELLIERRLAPLAGSGGAGEGAER